MPPRYKVGVIFVSEGTLGGAFFVGYVRGYILTYDLTYAMEYHYP